ncbi:MAG: disulfide bond formation protein B [Rhodobacteraceae bacterium]|nr:MAG: disulfide bond formation protein B [Paracoccaceae bacterium]
MTRTKYFFMATLGSIIVLGSAYAFQHLGGMAPCKMCLWQRWPHGVAIIIGIVAIITDKKQLAWLGMLAALTTAALGLYHAGVELTWWQGPTTCTSGSIAGLSTDQLLDQIMNAPVVRCDEIAWSLWGISMAGWNAIASFALALMWVKAAIAPKI